MHFFPFALQIVQAGVTPSHLTFPSRQGLQALVTCFLAALGAVERRGDIAVGVDLVAIEFSLQCNSTVGEYIATEHRWEAAGI